MDRKFAMNVLRQVAPSLLVAIPVVKSLALTHAASAVIDCPICVDTHVVCPGTRCGDGSCEGWNVDNCPGSGEICSTFCGGPCTGTC